MRLRARRAGLEITGTLGVLLRLHHLGLTSRDLDGLTSRDLEEDLQPLEDADMRISPNCEGPCSKPRGNGV